ncbi:MAG: hypothetical protein M5U09_24055 [Gammaproteobacteria bacterium]|nr:hypothetical protein [Gammaproteobacteria bacterium]
MKLAHIPALLVLLAAWPAAAGADEIDPFVGSYEGEATVVSNGRESRRDLGVTITSSRDGFAVKWQTTTFREDGSENTKSYSIDFISSEREHIYRSAMKANLFGGREPLDPMKGDPYVWAHITDGTLVVHAMIITEDGGYEMQTYERTLVAEGLDLRFTRIRDGKPLREINTLLRRTNG